MIKSNYDETILAMSKGFISLCFCHYSFTLKFVSYLIVAASNQQIRVGEPI